MNKVYILLGSNLGDSKNLLAKARDFISNKIGIIIQKSSLYLSEAWGFSSENMFYNQAIEVSTEFSPQDVLEKLLAIEIEMGRVRLPKQEGYSSRVIDLDILFYNREIFDAPNLKIPHPLLDQRKFALLPLQEIIPNFIHPTLMKTMEELLRSCPDQGVVRKEFDFPTSNPYSFIAVEGTIGVGKTSLASMLARDFHAKLVLESFEENVFLPKFYANQERYAFPLELSFLAERYRQIQEDWKTDLFHDSLISDFFINKSLVFAGQTLEKNEFSLFKNLFDIIIRSMPEPDIFVYLYNKTTNLKKNIIKRGREYEQNISEAYLAKIQEAYLEYIQQMHQRRVLIIDVSDLDFVNNKQHYQWIVSVMMQNYEPKLYQIAPTSSEYALF